MLFRCDSKERVSCFKAEARRRNGEASQVALPETLVHSIHTFSSPYIQATIFPSPSLDQIHATKLASQPSISYQPFFIDATNQLSRTDIPFYISPNPSIIVKASLSASPSPANIRSDLISLSATTFHTENFPSYAFSSDTPTSPIPTATSSFVTTPKNTSSSPPEVGESEVEFAPRDQSLVPKSPIMTLIGQIHLRRHFDDCASTFELVDSEHPGVLAGVTFDFIASLKTELALEEVDEFVDPVKINSFVCGSLIVDFRINFNMTRIVENHRR